MKKLRGHYTRMENTLHNDTVSVYIKKMAIWINHRNAKLTMCCLG